MPKGLLHDAIRRKSMSDIKKHMAQQALINQPNEKGDTPMHILCKTGYFTAYDTLVKQGASVNLRDQSGYLPLHCAAEAGHLTLLRELTKVTDDMNCQTAAGDTALLLACKANRDDCVKFLLEEQADSCVTNTIGNFAFKECLASGNTPMAQLLIPHLNDINYHFQGQTTPLFLACEYADFDCATLLLNKGADVSIANEAQEVPLHKACYNGMGIIVKRLIRLGGLVNASTVEGKAPMHYAAETGQVGIVNFLLDHHANVNTTTKDMVHAIHTAVEHDYVDILEVLANKGADINAKTAEGLTPLHIASERDHSDCFDFLLQYKADVEASTKKGWTALHSACHGGSLRAAKMLIQRGVYLDSLASDGSTPLHLACEQGNASCALMLLSENADALLANNKGENALHAAVKGGHIVIINRLLAQDVDLDVRTIDGQTITEIANHSHINCLQVLRSKGATINQPDTLALVTYRKDQDLPASHHLAVDAVHECEPDALCMALWDNPDCRQHLYFQKFAPRGREEVMASILLSLSGDPQTGQVTCRSGCDDFAGPFSLQQHKSVCQTMDWSTEPIAFVPTYKAPGGLVQKQKTTQRLEPYQRHVDRHRQVLAEIMDPDRVIDILYNNELISHENFQNYKMNSLGPISASKWLLWHFSRQPKENFLGIIESLKKGGQEHLAKLLTGQLECRRSLHLAVLQKHHEMLRENLDEVPRICDELMAKDVISLEEYESITPNKRPKQVYSLIDTIKRKTTEEYNMFLDVLDSSNQQHVADELRQAMRECEDNLAIEPQ